MLTRRQLLGLAGGAMALSTRFGRATAAPAAGRCTLGFSTYGMQSFTTEHALRVLAEIGFDAVEIAVRSGWDADSQTLGTKRRRALRKQLADSSLELSSLMEHVMPTTIDSHAVAIDRLKSACELAHELSPDAPPVVQTVLGGGQFEESKQTLRDRLGDWLRIAESTDTTIAIKPHRGGVVSQPAEAVWLINQLNNPPRMRMVYDYSHYAFRDLPLEETIATAIPYTAHIAVKDAVESEGRVVFRLPGETDTIDFALIIKQFFDGGYQGDINCEVSSMVSGRDGYDAIEAAKTCYRNLVTAFAEAGVPRGRRD